MLAKVGVGKRLGAGFRNSRGWAEDRTVGRRWGMDWQLFQI